MIRLPPRSIRALGCPPMRVLLPPAWITPVIFIRRGRLHRRAHRARRPPPRPPPRSAAPAKAAPAPRPRPRGGACQTHRRPAEPSGGVDGGGRPPGGQPPPRGGAGRAP